MNAAQQALNERGAAILTAHFQAQIVADEREAEHKSCPCIAHGVRLMSSRMTLRELSAQLEAIMIQNETKPWMGA